MRRLISNDLLISIPRLRSRGPNDDIVSFDSSVTGREEEGDGSPTKLRAVSSGLVASATSFLSFAHQTEPGEAEAAIPCFAVFAS